MLSLNVMTTAIFFKHPAYLNEAEWRFLRIRHTGAAAKELRFRQRKDALVRYVEFEWRNLGDQAIKEIRVGPAVSAGIGDRFAKDCLRAASFDVSKVTVEKSKIPYRGA
jgi:hypothetical protein